MYHIDADADDDSDGMTSVRNRSFSIDKESHNNEYQLHFPKIHSKTSHNHNHAPSIWHKFQPLFKYTFNHFWLEVIFDHA